MDDAQNTNNNNNNILQTNRLFGTSKLAVNKSYRGYDAKISPYNTLPIHVPFEIVETPEGELVKIGYKKLYSVDTPDWKIELDHIRKYENWHKQWDASKKKLYKERLIFHYKKAIVLMSEEYADGWNRWSEDILNLFISEKTKKVLWGSGNCGKSAITGLLLYIDWRVNPSQRMTVIATRIVADASARVFGYIKTIHTTAPKDEEHQLVLTDAKNDKGVYCKKLDKVTGKWIKDDRACIIHLPIKVDAKKDTIGGNLLGKHPQEKLTIAFDEAQELPGTMLNERIFLNWYTNDNLSIFAWGNPEQVDFHNPESWDLLFAMGAGFYSKSSLNLKKKESNKTGWWGNSDTRVLHFSMMDSPKDDPEERQKFIKDDIGNKRLRLHFLAGAETVKKIQETNSPDSPEYHSQVLGFPYIDVSGMRNQGVLTPFIVKAANRYELKWHTPEHRLTWLMGVDPSVSGYGDACSIVIARMGLMMDNRIGIDFMGGKHCCHVEPIEGEDFVDTTIKKIHELAIKFRIPLKQIAVETHSTGEVIRYALQGHIKQNNDWPRITKDETFYIVSPASGVTERTMFQQLGRLKKAKDMVADFPTEVWVGVRCGVLTRQIFNLPENILKQFYNRILNTTAGGKYRIESKKDMVRRGIKSPNDADATTFLVELARRLGFSYKFYNKEEYTDYYGAEYEENLAIKNAQNKVGIATRLLQIQNNFAPIRKTNRNFIEPI